MGSEEDKESSLNRKLSAYLLPFSEGGVQLFRSASFPGESHWPPFVWDCIPIKRELAPKHNKGPAFSAEKIQPFWSQANFGGFTFSAPFLFPAILERGH